LSELNKFKQYWFVKNFIFNISLIIGSMCNWIKSIWIAASDSAAEY